MARQSLSVFRKKQKELRERDLIHQAVALRNVSPSATLKAALDLNRYASKLVMRSARKKGMRKKEVMREAKKTFRWAADESD